MDRQAFSKNNLEKTLRKADFRGIRASDKLAHRDSLLKKSQLAAKTNFSEPSNPLKKFKIKDRTVFKIPEQSHRIIERKITWNVRRVTGTRTANRNFIVANLKSILSEGVAYRIYRLDIRTFYESFNKNHVINTLDGLQQLSPHTKRLAAALLNRHMDHGGTGLPRGIGLSATLSEFLMRDFDELVRIQLGVFFYARYVDDIIIITSGRENKDAFLAGIKRILPTGLALNSSKFFISSAIPHTKEKPRAPGKTAAEFEYLGYRFMVINPQRSDERRPVGIDIATSKVKKYKTRLTRAFHYFSLDRDWHLLIDRVKYLANNFSVYNPHIGKKKLAGIYHNYPLAESSCAGLKAIDQHLRLLTLNSKNRIGKRVSPLLDHSKKRLLLSNLFTRGHASRSFVHFSATRISEIKKCWEN